MKIIFLDFDGVLNHEHFYRTRSADKKAQDYPSSDFDEMAIQNLNRICDETGAKVVVSSTWRSGRTPEQLQEILAAVGFTGEVIGKTPHGRDDLCLRGNEILAWIKANETLLGCGYHDFHSYVIIDDDSDFLYWQREHLILVDGYAGLTHNRAYKAVRLFKQFSDPRDGEIYKVQAKSEHIKILIDLRGNWINQQMGHNSESQEFLRLQIGIYMLDEAIKSIEKGKVWHYPHGKPFLNMMTMLDAVGVTKSSEK